MNDFNLQDLVICGPLVHCEVKGEVTIIENAVVSVKNGTITKIEKNYTKDQINGAKVLKLGAGQFLCPGFLDLHIHAPQYPNIGLGSDLPLMEWLEKYTFPLEEKYADLKFAQKVYSYAVKSSLHGGTTTACYFGTIHTESTIELGKIICDIGQRALVGKVCMNQNSPVTYSESTDDSVSGTEKFVDAVLNMKTPLLRPIITPRFAISCDMDLQKKLASIAKEKDVHIQTHISENKNEVAIAAQTFPDSVNYADIYDRAGLLTSKTILAHGIYLSKEEMELISRRGSCIAHCPNSNTFLKSGLCDLRQLWDNKINVGLGTDVGGGSNLSILDTMRCAITTSIHLSFIRDNYCPINYKEAFYLATLGGAKALGMDKVIGNFKEGKEFDALIVNMLPEEGSAGVLTNHTTDELLQKFIFTGNSFNIKQVYVNGKLIKSI